MVNIRVLQCFIGRMCGVLVIAGFLIRPATGSNGIAATAISDAVESTANDLTFEGQGLPIRPPLVPESIRAPLSLPTFSEGRSQNPPGCNKKKPVQVLLRIQYPEIHCAPAICSALS